MRFSSITFCALILCTITLLGCTPFPSANAAQENQPDPLDTFEIADGFQIELIAGEPLIADPVAIEIDETGQVYVLEMPGYPLDVEATGRIKLLTDEDGDGTLDTSIIFADGLVLPTGLMRWKNGFIVTAPPDVIFLEDTDGDQIADRREVILTGFARSNPQHNFNKPLFGLDNWIYLANNGIIHTTAYKDAFGDRGSEVHFPANPDGPRLGANGNSRNVRFRPNTFEIESLAGRSQFGQTFDTWGHHFLLDNANPQYHEVIAARYLERNPQLSPRLSMNYTPAYGRNTAIFPITRDPEHQLLTDRGMITSAAGITYYNDSLFPDTYRNISIVGEPVHNLIHLLKVRQDGATFIAERLEERKEFLASTDSWFRPVNFTTGPDGALYVVDYHRQIVEHPEWMDEETARSGKLKNGTDMGRIYRITPTGTAPATWMNALSLDKASAETLVSHLSSGDIWHRRTAQRLLLDRKDETAIPHLIQMLQNAPDASARLHALWTLEGYGKLTGELVRSALGDPHPGVRENALILAEHHATENPSIWDDMMALEMDSDARVRFQLLCSLGFLDTPESKEVRRRLLLAEIDDTWFQLAALSAEASVDMAFLNAILPTLSDKETDGRNQFLQRLAGLIMAHGNKEDVSKLTDLMLAGDASRPDWWRLSIIEGAADGMRRADIPAEEKIRLRSALLDKFGQSDAVSMRHACFKLLETLPLSEDVAVSNALDRAIETANHMNSAAALRAQSVKLLALYAPEKHRSSFQALLTPSEPQSVQIAATEAIGRSDNASNASFLLGKWASLTPAVRNVALDQLMGSKRGMQSILEAIENGTVQTSTIGWNRTVRLMRDTEGALKEKARMLLSEPPGVREQVVESYFTSLDLNGDVESGGKTFEQTCGTCHQVAGEMGTAFGPDLGTVRHWSARALLAKILMPQRTVADGYSLWSVTQKNGTSISGIIASESPSSITLRQQGQQPITIARSEVDQLENLNVSAMPAGFENQLSRQQMADLIAFLRFN